MYSFASQLILLISAGSISGQEVIFDDSFGSGSDPGNSGNVCTTRSGSAGRCLDVRECPQVFTTLLTNPPVHCGFSGAYPVICCPKSDTVSDNPVDPPVPLSDISPPDFDSDFVCGRSASRRVGTLFPRFRRATPFGGQLEAFPVGLGTTVKPQVVGGFESFRNAWPWMALLGSREGDAEINWFCAGVLINDQWILTAAHCLDTRTPQIVRLGEHDHTTTQDGANHKDFGIQKMIRFSNYTYPVAYHDLALLQLDTKVKLQTFISPVCLPWGGESQKDLTGTRVKLTGWGDTQFAGSPSSTLQEVDLTMFRVSKCERSYSNLRQFSLFWPNGMNGETACAGDKRGGRDACQGDSGGPITYRSDNGRYVVNGIVSNGYGCGNKDYPGIYANVQYPPHLAWIKQVAF